MIDPVELTARLLREDTVNPPGNEARCMEPLAALLEEAGFRLRRVPLAEGRPNLVARLGPEDQDALAFTGHLDVVPLGEAEWSVDPFGGEIRDGRIYGRGASDMKSGVAAIVAAALAFAERPGDGVAIELVLTSGEEVGLEGARRVVEAGALGRARALVVAEPTGLRPCLGYRGVLWVDLLFRGVTAHASRPQEGDNAILKACRAALTLAQWDFDGVRHPLLDPPSLNVGRIRGGLNYNSVPDRATLGLDLRLLPGQDPEAILQRLAELSGCAEWAPRHRIEGVWTEPEHPWIRAVVAHLKEAFGIDAPPATVPFCTDASALLDGYGAIPVLVLGPGETEQAHRTDEWCDTAKIRRAAEIYLALMRAY